AVAGLWTGGFLDTAKTHHRSYKGSGPPAPAGEVIFQDLKRPGWFIHETGDYEAAEVDFSGHYLHGGQVILSYRVDGRTVLDVPSAAGKSGFFRTLLIGNGRRNIYVPALGFSGGTPGMNVVELDDGRKAIEIPAAARHMQLITLRLTEGGKPADPPVDPRRLIKGGPSRWHQVSVTAGVPSTDDKAYVADEMKVPLENPWGAWMRTCALDFFDDGRMVVSTINGDVWIVTWEGDDISRLTWRRFATGLYEPMGLRVVADRIYVRGRDRITRLHDLNNDGEADYYERFHSEGPVGQGYHAFIFDLVTDRDNNFYFALSGRKSPYKGGVVRIDANGENRRQICTGFRHPNGLGLGGPHDWLIIGDNASGKFPAGASIVKPGRSYGYEAPMTWPMLYVLPPSVDTSPGGMCWTDAKRWGPLGGSIIHTSYSKGNISYVMVQETAGHANGFAVKMPWRFPGGIMRARVNPADGQLYVVGKKGWDSSAVIDGCVYRIRHTGKPAHLISRVKAVGKTLQLGFTCDLDPELVEPASFSAKREGKDVAPVKLGEIKLLDPRTVSVEIPELDPAHVLDEGARKKHKSEEPHYRVTAPIALSVDLESTDGVEIIETVYATVNGL
ncbi:MAG: DUF6797 domain-containing protein, partial [Verrucomicrobiota bacterium]